MKAVIDKIQEQEAMKEFVKSHPHKPQPKKAGILNMDTPSSVEANAKDSQKKGVDSKTIQAMKDRILGTTKGGTAENIKKQDLKKELGAIIDETNL